VFEPLLLVWAYIVSMTIAVVMLERWRREDARAASAIEEIDVDMDITRLPHASGSDTSEDAAQLALPLVDSEEKQVVRCVLRRGEAICREILAETKLPYNHGTRAIYYARFGADLIYAVCSRQPEYSKARDRRDRQQIYRPGPDPHPCQCGDCRGSRNFARKARKTKKPAATAAG